MSKKFDPEDYSVSHKTEYYAVSKDGMYKEKLKDIHEAFKVKKEGKYKFGVNYRELLMVEMECTVYEKQIQTSRRWIEL